MAHELTVTFGAGKRVNASYKGFEINTDQPAAAGGDGSAPEPYSLFLASIGTCAGIYVLGFCQSRGLDAEGIRIVQNMEWDRETKTLKNVTLDIHVPPTFPERYHDALVRVADQCAVKKAIAAQPHFDVRTVVD